VTVGVYMGWYTPELTTAGVSLGVGFPRRRMHAVVLKD